MSSATGGWRANRKTGNCNPFDKCDYPAKVRCVLRISLDGGARVLWPTLSAPGTTSLVWSFQWMIEQTICMCPKYAAIFFSSEEKFYTIKP